MHQSCQHLEQRKHQSAQDQGPPVRSQTATSRTADQAQLQFTGMLHNSSCSCSCWCSKAHGMCVCFWLLCLSALSAFHDNDDTTQLTHLNMTWWPSTGMTTGLPIKSSCFCSCWCSKASSICVCLALLCLSALRAQLAPGEAALLADLVGDS